MEQKRFYHKNFLKPITKESKKSCIIGFRLEEALFNQLSQRAEQEGMDLSNLVRKICRGEVQQNAPQM